MLDALTEFFFKYRPVVFEKGHVVFGLGWGARLGVLAMAIGALLATATYTRVRVRGTADRIALGVVRALAVVLLAFALLRPALLVSAAVSHRNVVGVLIDDSHSMQVRDMQGRTRADVVRALLGSPDSALYQALSKRFVVRLFRLSKGGGAVNSVGDLTFDGARTRLAPALEGVRQELSGAPLAGVVLASDGVDNAPRGLDETLLSLNARHVPVFTVGIGQERFARDIEVTRIEGPQRVLKGSAIILSIDLTQRGFGGSIVPLVVEDSGRIVSTENIKLPKDGEATTLRVRVPATSAGARLFTVRIPPQSGELVRENNAQTTLITVRDGKARLLYIEGEPRYELKFLHLAVDDDPNLQLATTLRTAKDKFFRLSVDNASELANGFPRTREELFAYDGIVLGSIEASYFTFDQLQMISDFVSERGGGLLMLGGRTSFAEGGYAGTPVADALPVELTSDRRGKTMFRQVKVDVTPIGSIAALTQIGDNEGESAQKWKHMPAVTSVNYIARAKPGAVTLLEGTTKGGDPTVVLARQRYGRGTAMAFPIQDSWLWQMRPDTRVGDPTYQNFWRQTFRWLINDAPQRVTVTTSADRTWLNEPVQLDASVADARYQKVANATVTATIRTPSASTLEQLVAGSVTGDGTYHLSYIPRERGVYRIVFTAHGPANDVVTSNPVFIDAGTPTSEYTGAELRASLLQRVAEATGGRYYTPANAPELAKDLVYAGGGNTSLERLDLWDMPIVLIGLLILLASEWGYRRIRGLV